MSKKIHLNSKNIIIGTMPEIFSENMNNRYDNMNTCLQHMPHKKTDASRNVSVCRRHLSRLVHISL